MPSGCDPDDEPEESSPRAPESPKPGASSGGSSPRGCASRRQSASQHEKTQEDDIGKPVQTNLSHPVIFPPEVMEQLRQDAERLGKITLIGHIAGEDPKLEDIQEWINEYLTNSELHPEIQVNQVCLLARGYFTMTFLEKAGADKALSLSPVKCNDHIMFLHSWTPNFSPPPGESVVVWVGFPGLPRIYYPYLEYIANSIGRVVWQSDKASNIQRGCPPKMRILVADVRVLPGSVSIPLAIGEGSFEQLVSYEGMSKQICSKCKSLTISKDEAP